ncbi:MAG: RNA polymerase sigma factor [Verrucomicrobiales bacterium]
MKNPSDNGIDESWIAELQAPLFRFALSLGLATQDAEDVVQDALVALHRTLEKKPGSVENVKSYAFTIVRNNANRRFREKARRNEVEMTEEHPDQEVHTESLEEPLLMESFKQAYAKLLPQEREIIQKYYVDGWTYARIGNEMGCSPQNVWKLIKKIVSKILAGELRKVLHESDPDFAKELFTR